VRFAAAAATALALCVVAAAPLRADWLAPDPSLREAQMQLRYAARDTAGRGHEVAPLDTLAAALLRLGRLDDARRLFERVRTIAPEDRTALAGLGKLALFADRPAAAESLLVAAGDVDQARRDLYFARLRLGDWKGAAELCESIEDDGRRPLLEHLAEAEPVRVTGDRTEVWFERIWPAPLVYVKLNGARVLMLVDTGSPGLLIDRQAATQNGVTLLEGQRSAPWDGARVVVRNATVRQLDIGDVRLEGLPAGVLSLHRLSLEVNPRATPIAGVIGLDVLRRFDVTFDYRRRRLGLAPLGSTPATLGTRVPYAVWGEADLTVWGSIQGGRPMAMVVATGLAGAGVGAPEVVFEELGLKSGGVSKAVQSMGTFLNGRPWSPVRVPSLTLGSVAFERLAGWSGAMEPIEMWRHGVRRDALLGPGVLLKRRVTFDWTRREIAFEDGD